MSPTFHTIGLDILGNHLESCVGIKTWFCIQIFESDKTFVIYCVEVCTHIIIPAISNNVQTREIHKFTKDANASSHPDLVHCYF